MQDFHKICRKAYKLVLLYRYMETESLKLSDDTSEKVTKASEILGIKKQELIDRALLVYLDNIDKYLDLRKELKFWDSLSDEALINFEKLL